ncbi:MAG: hypothetical protein FJ403_16830 [Verrucomicrobia bacterium]|nr:hypothetical protein [Verrucomicrobiota bacterium]
MSKACVVNVRIPPEQERRLSRLARRLGRTLDDTSALLVEEGLRRAEFALIDFRHSPAGRQGLSARHTVHGPGACCENIEASLEPAHSKTLSRRRRP